MESSGDASPARTVNGAVGGLTVVGIGASAGGLQALRAFFESVPPDGGMAYVVIVHLDPDHVSELVQLIQNRANIPVQWASDALVIEPNNVYVIPPGQELRLAHGALRLAKRSERGAHAPIDLFFRTLAEACGSAAMGVVLSGTGQDGAVGLKLIKEAGGVTAAQAPEEAEFDAMPRSAIATGLVDLVLSVGEIASELERLHGEPFSATRSEAASAPTSATEVEVEDEVEDQVEVVAEDEDKLVRQILGRLRSQTGHDFSQYKLATVHRRIERRASFRRAATLAEYRDLLRSETAEVRALLKDLMISVSSFFRDPEAFRALEREVIPGLFAGKEAGDRVRVWIPGCSTGEEVYSIAILLLEHAAGLDEVPEIQIFATDIDENALAVARDGRYPITIAADVSPERLSRFFTREDGGYRATEPVREVVLVAKHDLLRDAPFSRLDLVSCRNLLIYLMPEAQTRCLEVFHYALGASGRLFLGSSESANAADDLFTPVDKKHRIFEPIESSAPHRLPIGRSGQDLKASARHARDAPEGGDGQGLPREIPLAGALHLRMLEAYAPPSLVVNDAHEIVHLSDRAGGYLRIGAGEPTRDLLELARGDLRVELRTALYQALEKGRATRRQVVVEGDEGPRPITLVVHPLDEKDETENFALVVFEESVGEETDPDSAGRSASQRSDDETFMGIREELRKTRTELEEIIEEREGVVEEYQAALEELQSINEEQSVASEELETSREELQSTNEELVTINQEHRHLIAELNHANADLRNLIDATSIGTVFLDRELRVRRFTPAAQQLINLLESDVGRPISDLSHRIDDQNIARDAKRVMQSLETIESEVSSDDRWFTLRIIPYRLTEDRIDGVVVTFFEITRQKSVEAKVREKTHEVEAERARLQEVLENMQAAVLLADAATGRIITVNQRFKEILREDFSSDEALDANDLADMAFQLDGTACSREDWAFTRARKGETVRDEMLAFTIRTGERVTILMSAAPLNASNSDPAAVVMSMTDISARRQMEEELQEAKEVAESAKAAQTAFMANVSHELRTPLSTIMGYAEILLYAGEFDEGQRQKLERIKIAGGHLSAMIEEILAFERLEEGDVSIAPSKADARDLAREVAALVELSAQDKGLELHLELPPHAVDLVTDQAKARQVLVNLMVNAVRYTSEGEIRLSLRVEEDRVIFDVRDTGIGIAPENHERIFDRFWQAGDGSAPKGGGVGIGLAVARTLSRLLGGDVELQSEPGRGSTFTVWLPLSMPNAAPMDRRKGTSDRRADG